MWTPLLATHITVSEPEVTYGRVGYHSKVLYATVGMQLDEHNPNPNNDERWLRVQIRLTNLPKIYLDSSRRSVYGNVLFGFGDRRANS